MIRIEKSNNSLLFLIALVPYLCFAQMSNEGDISIKSGAILNTAGAFENKQGANLINDGELYVHKDFTNNGLISFTSNQTSGKTWFMNNSDGANLSISGTGTSKFNNVEFINTNSEATTTAGFSLGNKLSVSGIADFQKGIIIYAPNFSDLLTFESNAIAINMNNISYVNGAVVKNGSNTFVYPVGNNQRYRPIAISAPSEAEAVFKGQYFFKNPDDLHPLTKKESSLMLIDKTEYWKIERTDASTSNVVVTLSWDAETTPSEIFADPTENIHVARWDDVKNLWIDEGGIILPDSSRNEVATTVPSLGNYGIFTLARVNKNVPPKDEVELSNFAISPNGDGLNDELKIKGLEAHPNNRVTVFDRLGKVMFDTTIYNEGNVFRGISSDGKVMPLGTYFYTVEYLDEATGHRIKKSNYLYINLK